MAHHTDTPRSGHPIEAMLCAVLDELKGLADVPTWSMDAATTTRVVRLAARVVAGAAELEARTIHQADILELPAAAQCRNTARWVQQTTGVTGRTARAKAKLAARLAVLEPTRTATARGEIHAEQAQAIADHIALLDDERVSTPDQTRAEAFLLEEATHGRDADDLHGLGHAIWERLDPEGADEREARALEAQEERARRKTRLTMGDDGQGLTHGRFTLPTAAADAFRKHLHALAAPKHVRAEHGAGSYDWHKPSAERMGQAFVEWVEGYDPAQLPKIGGLSASIVVIGDYETLQGTMKAATLETGTRISPTEYLRLACAAGIIPAWMNASGEVLALGRRHRFHNAAQRLAATIEQRHCQHPSGCDVPAYLCQAHHDHPWATAAAPTFAHSRTTAPTTTSASTKPAHTPCAREAEPVAPSGAESRAKRSPAWNDGGVERHPGASARRPDLWRVVVRACLSLIVLGALLFLLFTSAYIMGVQCDDNCPDDYTSEGRYTGQFVMACVGAVLGLAAVIEGFGRRGAIYYSTATGAAVVLFGWFLWLTGGGF